MKKIISVIIAAIMMISALVTVATVIASATDGDNQYPEVTDGSITSAAVKGDWNAYAAAGSYGDCLNEDGSFNYNAIPENSNVPGIRYTEDGFQAYATYDKSRLGETQRFNIMSTRPVNLKEGFTMTVRVDEFNYSAADHWFSFSIWDSENIAQGDGSGKFGNGYSSLIRPDVKVTTSSSKYRGLSTVESFISDQRYYNTPFGLGTATAPATWGQFGVGNATRGNIDYVQPNGNTYVWNEEDVGNSTGLKDDDGNAVIEIKLTYDEDFGYNLTIAGVSVNPVVLNHYLSGYNGFNYNEGDDYYNGEARFADGYAYIGFSVHSAASDTSTAVTITEFNGEKPAGTDERKSSCTVPNFGPIIDTSNRPASDPVLSITSTKADDYNEVGKFPGTSNLTYTANKDGTFTIKPGLGASFVTLQPKSDASYSIKDYPVFAVVLKDYCTCVFAEGENECKEDDEVSLYLSSGAVLAASGTYNPSDTCEIHQVSSNSPDGHDYKVFIFDFNEIAKVNDKWDASQWQGWEARIHKVQVVFNYSEGLIANEGQNHFSLCYAGFFKTTEAAKDYTGNILDNVKGCEHNEEYLQTKEATVTCEKIGYNEGVYCSNCGMWKETVTDSNGTTSEKWNATRTAVAALGHDWAEATCTAPKTCTRCQATDGDALGHEYETKSNDTQHWSECIRCTDKKDVENHSFNALGWCATCGYTCEHKTTEHKKDDPTCTTNGAEYDLCSNCGAQVNKQSIATTGHKYEVVTKKDATCTEPGYGAYRKCSVCGNEVGKKENAALGHKWNYVNDDDSHWKKCSRCGVEDASNKEAHSGTPCSVCGYGCEHATTVDVEEVAATCIAAGTTAGKKCSVCGQITEGCIEIPATGEHTYVVEIEAIKPTCKQTGYTAKEVCSVCGNTIEQEELPMADHTPEDIAAVAPTCTESGKSKGQKCSVCGVVIVEQAELPALGHTWVEATCTEAKHCTVCKATEGEALGHKWVEATCAAPKTCSVCNATEGEALPHTWVDATCTMAKTCSVCGAKDGEALGHTWVDATCTEAKYCSVCNEKDGLAPGHNYGDDGVCTVCGDKKEINTQKPEDNTQKNEESTKKNEESTKKDNTSNKKKGCGSVAGLSAIAISATVALAGVVCLKKKKED